MDGCKWVKSVERYILASIIGFLHKLYKPRLDGGKIMDILNKLKSHRQEEEQLKWEGTFAEYLEIVKERPEVAQTAHSRVYNMIKSAGISERNGNKMYHFFGEEIFGLEEAMERLVEEYFHPAAKRLDVKKRILLLMGPVSGGKSTIVTLLKRGLEAYSRTEEGAVYAIKGCPMHEDPRVCQVFTGATPTF